MYIYMSKEWTALKFSKTPWIKYIYNQQHGQNVQLKDKEVLITIETCFFGWFIKRYI